MECGIHLHDLLLSLKQRDPEGDVQLAGLTERASESFKSRGTVFDGRADEAFVKGNGERAEHAVGIARIAQPAIGEIAAVFIKRKTTQRDLIQNDVHGRCFGCDGEVDLNLLSVKCRVFKADFRLRGQRKVEKQR